MSYLPFSPDVKPIPADQYVPPRSRAGRWAIGVVSYFALIAAWLWWMTLPPKIQPPLATIPLPDGTELRLVGALRGAAISVQSDNTFGDRLRPSSTGNPDSETLKSGPATGWFVFTQFDPAKTTFHKPTLEKFAILDETPARFPWAAQEVREPRGFRGQVLSLAVVPARTPTLAVEFVYDGQPIRATLPNPFYSAKFSELTPQPLPQTAALDGATITLQAVQIRKSTAFANGSTKLISFVGARAVPAIQMTCGGLRESDFETSYWFFDASGNVLGNDVQHFVLPFSEPAWGLRVRAVQRTFENPDPAVMVPLGDFAVPAADVATGLPVLPALAIESVSDILLVGKGSYAAAGGALRFKGEGAVGRQPFALASYWAQFSETVDVPSLLVINHVTQKPARELPSFVARVGEKLVPCSLESTTTGEAFYLRRFAFNSGIARGLPPGTKVTVYSIKPKVFEATFHFPTPPPPDVK